MASQVPPGRYHDICYAVFRDKELPHPAAPQLLQCVARAGSHPNGVLDLEDDGAWLRSQLLEIGFADDGAVLRADATLIERLQKEQNAARLLVHKEAAAAREALLDGLLRGDDPSPAASSARPPSSPARRAPSPRPRSRRGVSFQRRLASV